MKLALFGATGATGLQVVQQALAHGLTVRALVRAGHGGGLAERGVEIVEGDLLNSADVFAVVQGCDAVCCVIGPRPPYTDIFCGAATQAIVAAMRQARVERLVCQTGAMIGDYPANRTWPFRLMVAQANRRMSAMMVDRLAQEQAVCRSGLQWTVVKPPRLTMATGESGYRAAAKLRVGMLSSISREALAAFIVAELLSPQHVGEAVFVSSL